MNQNFSSVIKSVIKKKKKSLQHEVFPGGQPSKYYPRPTGFDVGDQTRPSSFPVV